MQNDKQIIQQFIKQLEVLEARIFMQHMTGTATSELTRLGIIVSAILAAFDAGRTDEVAELLAVTLIATPAESLAHQAMQSNWN